MSLPPNPYEFSNPVYRDGEFFGRLADLERLSRAFASVHSVQVIGPSRIGKTSLLKYIVTHAPNFFENECMIPIYYDLARAPRLRDGNDFFARTWQLISLALVERGQTLAALPQELDLTDPYAFESYVKHWGIEGYHFFLLLDEFDLVARDIKFDRNFFDNVRNSISTLPITYVFAAPSTLAQLAHPAAQSSQLWNLLAIIRLRLFEDRESIRDLICRPAERIGLPWSDTAKGWIYELGGQHPCFVQMAAAALYDSASGKEQWNFSKAELVFRDTAVEHFRHFWATMQEDPDRPDRRTVLQNGILDLVRVGKIEEGVAEDLRDRGLVWYDDSLHQWNPLSQGFADWLKQWTTSKREKTVAESRRPILSDQLAPLEAGQVLEDKYQIMKWLSITGHSQLALAWDLHLQRLVAIKCLRVDQLAGDDELQRLRERLRREGQILVELEHENIGKVHTTIEEPPAVVMDWIFGCSLREILGESNHIPIVNVLEIGIAIADALKHAHSKRVFHRDIKPSNIILTVSPKTVLKPVLIDFDIARASNRETITRRSDGSRDYIGTQPYSAPEQFLNPEGVGEYTDVFSLALVLYELLIGSAPFPQGNIPSLYSGGKFPRLKRGSLPNLLYDTLHNALNPVPDERPTAAEIKKKLEKCLNSYRRG